MVEILMSDWVIKTTKLKGPKSCSRVRNFKKIHVLFFGYDRTSYLAVSGSYGNKKLSL